MALPFPAAPLLSAHEGMTAVHLNYSSAPHLTDPAAAVRSHQEIHFLNKHASDSLFSRDESPLSLLSLSRGNHCNTFFCCHVRLRRFPPIFQPLLAFFCLPQVHQFPRSFLDNPVSISRRGFNLISCWYLWWPVFPGSASPTPFLVCSSECRHLHGFNPSPVSPFAWLIN